MMGENPFAIDRARDDLAFDPLPVSEYVTVATDGIRITTRYSEPLSRLLRSLPCAEWLAVERCWRVPFTARKALEAVLPQIEQLAAAAQDAPEMETRQRAMEEAARLARAEALAVRNARDRMLYGGRPRPLRREFLLPREGVFRIVIELELIGDFSPRAIDTGYEERPWVAQVFGTNGRGGVHSSRLKPLRDYSRANSRGTRGIYDQYTLEEGLIYEINERVTWRRTDRYFLRVWDGQKSRMTTEDVLSCIEK